MQLPGVAPDRSVFHIPPTGCCARRACAGSGRVAAVTAAGTHLRSKEWMCLCFCGGFIVSWLHFFCIRGSSWLVPFNVIMLPRLIRVD